MPDDVQKLTPFDDRARRRMYMKGLTNVAILPGGRGANPEANVTFFKSVDKQEGKRDDETEAEFQARRRREREAAKQEEERRRRRRRRRRDDPNYEKQEGPREGETFEQFLARMREDDPDMTESRARRMFRGDADKAAGDLVDVVTSVNEGHQHGISINMHGDEAVLLTTFAGQDRESNHDHQMIRNEDGSYRILENFGHSHDDIPAEVIRSAIAANLMKQEFSAEERERLAESGAAMSDGSFPIRNASDLRNAIQAFGRANADDRAAVARHIQRRARALNLTDQLPEEGVLADLLKSAKKSEGQPPEGDPEMADNKELDALKAQLATATAVAALTGAHKTHYDTLGEDDQAEFLKMDDSAKDAAIKAAEAKKADADPVVYKCEATGEEFRKSDDPRMVSMAKRMDEDRKETIRLQKQAEDDALEKRAETDLKYHPGALDVRKALLKAADGIEDETVRNGALEALKAKSAQNASAFSVVGTSEGVDVSKMATDADDADDQIQKMARDLMKSDSSLTFEQAYVKALSDPANANVAKHLQLS